MKHFAPGKIPPVRKAQCQTCVFRPVREGGIDLAPGRLAEIQGTLLQGTNQLCHHDDNKTICRGGRDWQTTIWYRLGWLSEPTDEALAAAIEAAK